MYIYLVLADGVASAPPTPSPRRASTLAPVAPVEELELLDLLVHGLDRGPATHSEPQDEYNQYKDPVHDLDRAHVKAEGDRLRHRFDALVRIIIEVPGQRRDEEAPERRREGA